MIKKIKLLCLAVFISAFAKAQVDTTIIGTLMAGATKTIYAKPLTNSTQVSIKNSGLTNLQVCISSSPTTKCLTSSGVTVPIGQTITTTVGQLGGLVNGAYLNVTNLIANISIGSYVARIIGQPGGTGPGPITPPQPPQPPVITACDRLNTIWYSDITKKQTYLCPKDNKAGIGDELHIVPFKLHIYGATSAYTPLTLDFNTTNTTNNPLKINLAGTDGYYYDAFHVFESTAGTQKYVYKFAGSAELSIQGTLYVGTKGLIPIGAANYKCMVNGKIKARDIDLTTNNWPDYVFEKNYRSKPLALLEKEILDKKHLPEINSSCDIEASGLPASEMLKLQMKKIEELTLYLIQQDKEIEQQVHEIEQLKATANTK